MSIDEQIKQLIEAQLAPLQSRISALESPSVDYATPPNTGALKKFAMRVSADGKTVRTSAFIADLERRISSAWTQRNARNKSQGEMSNLILEPSPGVRHALVRTDQKTVYLVPSTGNKGDLKIRLPNASHSTAKGIVLTSGKYQEISRSNFRKDRHPYKLTAPPAGW